MTLALTLCQFKTYEGFDLVQVFLMPRRLGNKYFRYFYHHGDEPKNRNISVVTTKTLELIRFLTFTDH